MKCLGFLVLVMASAAVGGGCGYSELEMQAQRDKTTSVIEALDRLAADQVLCRRRMSELEIEIAKTKEGIGGQ